MLSKMERSKLSKAMTLLLRHKPEARGLHLDPEDGSVDVEALLEALQQDRAFARITEADLEEVVRSCEKQRFELMAGRIRARYGHSKERFAYPVGIPPEGLYHGTNRAALAAIMEQGLQPMGRQYVHLSEGLHFATLAGRRRGELVLLRVDTVDAMRRGVTFYQAGHEVWLADHIPAACLQQWEDVQDKRC